MKLQRLYKHIFTILASLTFCVGIRGMEDDFNNDIVSEMNKKELTKANIKINQLKEENKILRQLRANDIEREKEEENHKDNAPDMVEYDNQEFNENNEINNQIEILKNKDNKKEKLEKENNNLTKTIENLTNKINELNMEIKNQLIKNLTQIEILKNKDNQIEILKNKDNNLTKTIESLTNKINELNNDNHKIEVVKYKSSKGEKLNIAFLGVLLGVAIIKAREIITEATDKKDKEEKNLETIEEQEL